MFPAPATSTSTPRASPSPTLLHGATIPHPSRLWTATDMCHFCKKLFFWVHLGSNFLAEWKLHSGLGGWAWEGDCESASALCPWPLSGRNMAENLTGGGHGLLSGMDATSSMGRAARANLTSLTCSQAWENRKLAVFYAWMEAYFTLTTN